MAFGLPNLPGISLGSVRVGVIGAIESLVWKYIAVPLTWGIYEPNSDTPAIEVDTVLSATKTGVSNVSTYPITKGSFSAYNKTNTPDTFQIRIVKSGDAATRKAFIEWLAKQKESATTFDIVTPETTYKNVTLTGIVDSRSVPEGTVTRIIADCTFTEIREVPIEYYKAGDAKADTTEAEQPQDIPVKQTGFAGAIERVATGINAEFNAVVGQVDSVVSSVFGRS